MTVKVKVKTWRIRDSWATNVVAVSKDAAVNSDRNPALLLLYHHVVSTVSANRSMTVSELFNIQSIPEMLGTSRLSCLPSALHKIYINLVEFYGKDPTTKDLFSVFSPPNFTAIALLLRPLAHRKLLMQSSAFSFQ